MLVLGLVLQLLGIVLILWGGVLMARDVGALERWSRRARLTVRVGVAIARDMWRRYALRKKDVVVRPDTIRARMGFPTATAVGSVRPPEWDSMNSDERIQSLRREAEELRILIDSCRDDLTNRWQEIQSGLEQFKATVNERFLGHDARDQAVLGYELAGGAISLLGTLLTVVGGRLA